MTSWTEYQQDQDPDLPVRSDDTQSVPSSALDSAIQAKDLKELAEDLLVPVAWIEEIDWLVKDKKAVIFVGPPGSGKTHVARRLAAYYSGGREVFVQFHPSYAYEDFVEGYRPTMTKSGELTYEVKPGILRDSLEEFNKLSSGTESVNHAIVIDEINRSNLGKVFGELFFAIEYRGTPVRTQYGSELVIPSDLVFFGTMNSADRSVSTFDAALRRRFHFVTCDPTVAPFSDILRKYFFNKLGRSDCGWLVDLLSLANEKVPDPKYAIGPAHFFRPTITRSEAEKVWNHSVWPYLTSRFDESQIADLSWDSLISSVDSDSGGKASGESLDAFPKASSPSGEEGEDADGEIDGDDQESARST